MAQFFNFYLLGFRLSWHYISPFISLRRIQIRIRFHPTQPLSNNGLTIRIWIEVADAVVWFLLCRKILLLIFFLSVDEEKQKKRTKKVINGIRLISKGLNSKISRWKHINDVLIFNDMRPDVMLADWFTILSTPHSLQSVLSAYFQFLFFGSVIITAWWCYAWHGNSLDKNLSLIKFFVRDQRTNSFHMQYYCNILFIMFSNDRKKRKCLDGCEKFCFLRSTLRFRNFRMYTNPRLKTYKFKIDYLKE